MVSRGKRMAKIAHKLVIINKCNNVFVEIAGSLLDWSEVVIPPDKKTFCKECF